jgi:hypothetical protein
MRDYTAHLLNIDCHRMCATRFTSWLVPIQGLHVMPRDKAFLLSVWMPFKRTATFGDVFNILSSSFVHFSSEYLIVRVNIEYR